jgi:hypothetical protein
MGRSKALRAILRMWALSGVLSCSGWLGAAPSPEAGSRPADGPTPPKIVGAAACKICHRMKIRGNQHAIWEQSAHAEAFRSLGSGRARAIAAARGLGDPQESAACLLCHTTAGALGARVQAMPTYDLQEGVGCEACHGPGSRYRTLEIMNDPAAALAAGMQRPDREHCLICHNESSPTYKGFAYEDYWPRIAHPLARKGE